MKVGLMSPNHALFLGMLCTWNGAINGIRMRTKLHIIDRTGKLCNMGKIRVTRHKKTYAGYIIEFLSEKEKPC
jgi:hypothetical protein